MLGCCCFSTLQYKEYVFLISVCVRHYCGSVAFGRIIKRHIVHFYRDFVFCSALIMFSEREIYRNAGTAAMFRRLAELSDGRQPFTGYQYISDLYCGLLSVVSRIRIILPDP